MKNPGRTHTGRMRGQYHYNRLQVLFLTGMSEEELSEFQFETGMEWLKLYAVREGNDIYKDNEARRLMCDKLVWQWWKNDWHQRDIEHLPLLYEKYGDDGSIADWLYGSMVGVDERGLVVAPDGLELDSAAAKLRHIEVAELYRQLHEPERVKCFLPEMIVSRK